MPVITHPNGWIAVDIPKESEDQAKEMRAERDNQYGNIFRVSATDARWVGDLGEIVFDEWLNYLELKSTWVKDNAAGKPDFIMESGLRIGVKTVKRKGPPQIDYTAQITARHAKEPTEQFFFMSYDFTQNRMWLLGGIERDKFLREARYYSAGEWVHPYYQVRPGHEIYNIEIEKLIRPDDWIKIIA